MSSLPKVVSSLWRGYLVLARGVAYDALPMTSTSRPSLLTWPPAKARDCYGRLYRGFKALYRGFIGLYRGFIGLYWGYIGVL